MITGWKVNAERLGVNKIDAAKWALRALQWLRLDAEPATTGAPEFEILLAIMEEGGYAEAAKKRGEN